MLGQNRPTRTSNRQNAASWILPSSVMPPASALGAPDLSTGAGAVGGGGHVQAVGISHAPSLRLGGGRFVGRGEGSGGVSHTALQLKHVGPQWKGVGVADLPGRQTVFAAGVSHAPGRWPALRLGGGRLVSRGGGA